MPCSDNTIIDDWSDIPVPPAPELTAVTVDPATTALLVLGIQRGNCNLENRPRCVATVPALGRLLEAAREQGLLVVHSLTRGVTRADLCAEVAPLPKEAAVQSGVDKFFRTELEAILRKRDIETVIVVGTSANGAVLHTATGAALRGLRVVVPVDGMPATDAYAEQYVAWHMLNAPGTRRQATLTRIDLITFG